TSAATAPAVRSPPPSPPSADRPHTPADSWIPPPPTRRQLTCYPPPASRAPTADLLPDAGPPASTADLFPAPRPADSPRVTGHQAPTWRRRCDSVGARAGAGAPGRHQRLWPGCPDSHSGDVQEQLSCRRGGREGGRRGWGWSLRVRRRG